MLFSGWNDDDRPDFINPESFMRTYTVTYLYSNGTKQVDTYRSTYWATLFAIVAKELYNKFHNEETIKAITMELEND